MRLLLDSQVVYRWMVRQPLPTAVDQAIADDRTYVAISAASFWELSIKAASGRLELPDDGFAPVMVGDFDLLAITPEHGIAAARLPQHHRDPFDRMLVAQAIAEGLTIVGGDRAFPAYDVPVLWD